MGSLSDGEFRTVIEDARARHAAVVALIYAADAQALSLMRLYVTLSIAAVSGAAASLGQTALFPRPVMWALILTAAIFVIGTAFCLRTLRSTNLNLPGRTGDFWQWAISNDVDRTAVLEAYLDNVEKKGKMNNDISASSGNALKWAKRCGVVAPVVALLTGAAAHYFSF